MRTLFGFCFQWIDDLDLRLINYSVRMCNLFLCWLQVVAATASSCKWRCRVCWNAALLLSCQLLPHASSEPAAVARPCFAVPYGVPHLYERPSKLVVGSGMLFMRMHFCNLGTESCAPNSLDLCSPRPFVFSRSPFTAALQPLLFEGTRQRVDGSTLREASIGRLLCSAFGSGGQHE